MRPEERPTIDVLLRTACFRPSEVTHVAAKRSAALYANRSLPLLKPQAARACGETDIRVPVIRSLALLKLRAFDEAEEDATATLETDAPSS